MKTVQRFKITPKQAFMDATNVGVDVQMPKGAQIVRVEFSANHLSMWALVDTEAETETRQFATLRTGQEIQTEQGAEWKYVGSATHPALPSRHVFEFVTA
jgi:hypothetical protein